MLFNSFRTSLPWSNLRAPNTQVICCHFCTWAASRNVNSLGKFRKIFLKDYGGELRVYVLGDIGDMWWRVGTHWFLYGWDHSYMRMMDTRPTGFVLLQILMKGIGCEESLLSHKPNLSILYTCISIYNYKVGSITNDVCCSILTTLNKDN